MGDTCGDNRFELIEKYKQKLLDATNIGDSPEEMAVIDNILFRFWQMGWLRSEPSAQPELAQDLPNACADAISRQAAIDAVEGVDWYHQNKNGEMVHGANSDEHQAWYKADDIYKAIESVPSAQPECEDTISRSHFDERVRLAGGISEEELTDDFKDGVLTVLEMLRTEPPVTSKQPGWIPCSKKLPELNRSVLVQLSDDFVDPIQIMTLNISKCEGDFFYFWETQEMGINFEMGDVVAWQPIPEPWEGAQNGTD